MGVVNKLYCMYLHNKIGGSKFDYPKLLAKCTVTRSGEPYLLHSRQETRTTSYTLQLLASYVPVIWCIVSVGQYTAYD